MGNCIIVQKSGSCSSYTAGDGIDITNNVISNTLFNASLNAKIGIDLNTITEAGVYYVYSGTAELNYPSGSNGLLIVTRTSGHVVRQFYFRVGTVDSNDYYWYSRQINESIPTYGEWVRFYNSKSSLTAGTGISISSDTINHSNSVTAQDTQAVYPITIDSEGHISAYGSAVTSMTPTSHTHGHITNAGDITTNVAIASGDRLVINDESASQLNNSSITFGTGTTTFLSNAGTWATPSKGSITVTKLWTNSSPATRFAAQTVSLSLTSYFGIHLIYMWYTDQNHALHAFIPKGVGSAGVLTAGAGQLRKVSVTNSGVTFDAGINSGDSAIPYQIWGVKLA